MKDRKSPDREKKRDESVRVAPAECLTGRMDSLESNQVGTFAAQLGDAGLEELQKSLVGYARALTGNIHDARDLVQTTFLRCLGKSPEVGKERSYAFRTLQRVYRNWVRSEKRRSAALPVENRGESRPEDNLEFVEAINVLAKELEKALPPKLAEFLRVCVEEQWDTPRVKAKLALTDGYYRRCLQRLRKAAKKVLHGETSDRTIESPTLHLAYLVVRSLTRFVEVTPLSRSDMLCKVSNLRDAYLLLRYLGLVSNRAEFAALKTSFTANLREQRLRRR